MEKIRDEIVNMLIMVRRNHTSEFIADQILALINKGLADAGWKAKGERCLVSNCHKHFCSPNARRIAGKCYLFNAPTTIEDVIKGENVRKVCQ